eukprot:gene973-1489_t
MVWPAELFATAVLRKRGAVKSRSQVRISAVFERFTERAIKVSTEHLLLGLVSEEGSENIFMGYEFSLIKARRVLSDIATPGPSSNNANDTPFSQGSKRVFEAALEESRRLSMSYIAPEHICLALLNSEDGGVQDLLNHMTVDIEAMKKTALSKLQGESEKNEGRRPVAASQTKQAPRQKEGGKQALDEFCYDLTAQAREGKIDPVIGRDEEVKRVTQILARRSKNNPILLGEPGVGKTAIYEGLARAIVNGDCSDFLKNKRLLVLDLGLLIGGAKERGELESRVKNILEETRSAGDVVLAIDEIHTLVGAGSTNRSSGGGLDISNLLKPALARGELQCIGATTVKEHRLNFEKDPALERRFQPVMIEEPTEEQAFEILVGLREKYESHHRCKFTDEALKAAVRISSRYIADRSMPDKCIDLVDEAGSRARIAAYKEHKAAMSTASLEEKEDALSMLEELRQVSDAKQQAIGDYLYEEASLLHDREIELSTKVADLGDMGKVLEETFVGTVGKADIESEEENHLTNLEEVLHERVIGQDEAVTALARSLRRASCGLQDPDRPIASMLFCGPTGVGKTELTKALAEKYFGSEENVVRLDMSEYMERHTVSKLVGAPPGYVGFGEGGALTEAVRKNPFTVVLFDEVEKAHPDIFNVLLQVLEDGRLTDSTGRTVSFKNTLIIMTSNIGSTAIQKGGGGLGFQLASNDEDGGQYSRMRDRVLEECKEFFRPEMLNRLDELVVFRQLEKSQIRQIANVMLQETSLQMAKMGVAIEFTEAAMDHLVDEGYDKTYGARPLRRAIMRIVNDTLAESLLDGSLMEDDVATMYMDEQGKLAVIKRQADQPLAPLAGPGNNIVVFSNWRSLEVEVTA